MAIAAVVVLAVIFYRLDGVLLILVLTLGYIRAEKAGVPLLEDQAVDVLTRIEKAPEQ